MCRTFFAHVYYKIIVFLRTLCIVLVHRNKKLKCLSMCYFTYASCKFVLKFRYWTCKKKFKFKKGCSNKSFSLKGQCHEIFECWFFHQIAPPGPHRGCLGRF